MWYIKKRPSIIERALDYFCLPYTQSVHDVEKEFVTLTSNNVRYFCIEHVEVLSNVRVLYIFYSVVSSFPSSGVWLIDPSL